MKMLKKILLGIVFICLLSSCDFTNINPQRPFIVKEIISRTRNLAYYEIGTKGLRLFKINIIITDTIGKYVVGDTLIFVKK